MARGIPVPAVIPEASKGFVVCVPDDPFFFGVVMGALKVMSFRYYWQGTPDQIDAVTERFTRMYYEYQEQLNCMDCDFVVDCVTSSEEIANYFNTLIQNSTTNPAQHPYGQNLPDSELSRDAAAGTNPECDPDIIWSQCLNVVTTTNQAITDALEKLEVSTNIAELVNGLIDVIPLLGTAKQILGISGVLDTLNYFQESIAEGYAAQYTTTPGGVQDQIACALFCACRDDCVISIERIEEVFRQRLASHITVPEISDFTDLIETIAGLEPDTTYVVDLAFWFAWVAVRVGNFLFGNTFNGGLDLVLWLAADEPSNDWEGLCDCPEAWEHDFDFTAVSMPAGWTVTGGTHSVGNGVKIDGDQGGGLFFGRVEFDPAAGFECTEFTLQFTTALADSFGQIFSPSDGSSYSFNFEELAGGETQQSGTGLPANFSALPFLAGIAGATADTMYLTGIHIEGFGFDPFA